MPSVVISRDAMCHPPPMATDGPGHAARHRANPFDPMKKPMRPAWGMHGHGTAPESAPALDLSGQGSRLTSAWPRM